MIIAGGPIRTLDPSLPLSRALAIAGERIVGGVGVHESALPTPDRVELGGRCVVPGLSDAHVHFPSWALAQGQVRLEDTRSRREAVERVALAAAARTTQTWVHGFGWRTADWGEAVDPTRFDLDSVSTSVPIALWSKDLHSLWLNTAALERAGGDLGAPGGVVESDAAGSPTGILREEAAWRFRDRYARPSEDELVEATRAALRLAHRRGVTAVHDKDGARGALGVWQRLERESSLSLRVWQSLPLELLPELEGLGLHAGLGSAFLRVGYLKAFMDGTLGSGTASLLDGSGVRLMSGDELAAGVRRAALAGWPVAVHAIGDRANREALDAFEATAGDWRPRGLRQRIEHAQLVHPDDVGRFARLGVACSVQFTHATSDRALVDERWAGRELAYPFRALWESGAVVANGSDAPVEELDPLLGIRAAAVRSLDERPPWRPEQGLTIEQALVATTVTPAWLAGDERRRGRLLPGFLADLVVLDRDPLARPPEELGEIRVVATMVGGRWVHNPPPWD